MQNDLTTGSVFRNVVSFLLPYLLSYFLQTLYGMADLFIIGQFEGVASTTAVSIGSQVMHMLTVMLVGLAMGATVSIAQAIGGGDKKRTASAIGNTVTLFMLLSLALTALLLALRGGIVSIMSTPEEAVQGTLAYLTVCFHHGVQHHRLDLPRPWRQQESHVLHRRGLRRQHRARLLLHGHAAPRPRGRSARHHAESPAQYRRLMQFIREEGYTAAGFSREITVIDYGFTTDTEKFVTEIMIPLQKV